MKLVFVKPVKEYPTFSDNLLKAYWNYHGIFPAKVKVSFNSFHDFWDVHVYRGMLFKSGRGSVEYQLKVWEDVKAKLKALHPDAEFHFDCWSWETPGEQNTWLKDSEVSNGRVYCPAIRIWFRVVEQDNDHVRTNRPHPYLG